MKSLTAELRCLLRPVLTVLGRKSDQLLVRHMSVTCNSRGCEASVVVDLRGQVSGRPKMYKEKIAAETKIGIVYKYSYQKKHTYFAGSYSALLIKLSNTVGGRNPAPPNMYETL